MGNRILYIPGGGNDSRHQMYHYPILQIFLLAIESSYKMGPYYLEMELVHPYKWFFKMGKWVFSPLISGDMGAYL